MLYDYNKDPDKMIIADHKFTKILVNSHTILLTSENGSLAINNHHWLINIIIVLFYLEKLTYIE